MITTRARRLRFSGDYECFPLWEAEPGLVDNVDPSDLPISDGLRADLIAWAERFDARLDWNDPGAARPIAPEDLALDAEAVELVDRLRRELGTDWTIVHLTT